MSQQYVSKAERLDGLEAEVVRLQDLVTELQRDLKQELLGRLERDLHKGFDSFASEQDALKRKVKKLQDFTSSESAKQATIEERVEALELDREATARNVAKSFESLSVRLTELGMEAAELPPGAEVKSGLDRITALERALEEQSSSLTARCDASVASLSTRLQEQSNAFSSRLDSERKNFTECLDTHGQIFSERAEGLLERLEELDALIAQERLVVEEALEARAQETATLIANALKKCLSEAGRGIDAVRTQCGNDSKELVGRLARSLWGESEAQALLEPAAADFDEAEPAAGESGSFTLALSRSSLQDKLKGKPLIDRLNALERPIAERLASLEQELQKKANVDHTHDRLLSVDGSVSFVV